MNKKADFAIYPTLLDMYTNYVKSDTIWEKYWGYSNNPLHTPEEFHELKFMDLIDAINRVEGEVNEAADRGTCFNEVVDCIILNRPTQREDMTITSDKENNVVRATLHGFSFEFPLDLCMRWAKKYKGAIPQHRCEAMIDTPYGTVKLYGYIDELMPFSIHDIKTTGSYNFGKFRDNWQHRVYPYCMAESGMKVESFQYDILEIGKDGKFDDYCEFYGYRHESVKDQLYWVLVDFISFLKDNDRLIDRDKTHIFI